MYHESSTVCMCVLCMICVASRLVSADQLVAIAQPRHQAPLLQPEDGASQRPLKNLEK